MKRSIMAVITCTVLLMTAAGCSLGGDDSSGDGGDNTESDANTVKVYAVTSIDGQLEQLADAYKQDAPDSNIEFTFGPAEELAQKILDGESADVFISRPAQVVAVRDGGKTQADAVLLGTDVLEVVTPLDNPSNVTGLNAFGLGSDVVTGLCSDNLTCGRNGVKAIEEAGIIPGDSIIEQSGSSLLERIVSGEIQAGLLYRTQAVKRINKTTVVNLPEESQFAIDYRIVQVSAGEGGKNFVAWVKDSKTADDSLKDKGLRAVLLLPDDTAPASTP